MTKHDKPDLINRKVRGEVAVALLTVARVRGASLEEIASRVGASVSAVGAWGRGIQSPSEDSVTALSKFIGVQPWVALRMAVEIRHNLVRDGDVDDAPARVVEGPDSDGFEGRAKNDTARRLLARGSRESA